MSGTEFSLFPLAVSYYNDTETTFSFVNPDKQNGVPTWGNHCWWTDPPPPECEPNLCQISEHLCSQMPGGKNLLSTALNFRNLAGSVGKVANPEDLENIPPHLIPLVKTLDQLAKASGINLAEEDFSGMTVKFHR